jgi:NADPH-dependent curcumin reductase CurA
MKPSRLSIPEVLLEMLEPAPEAFLGAGWTCVAGVVVAHAAVVTRLAAHSARRVVGICGGLEESDYSTAE